MTYEVVLHRSAQRELDHLTTSDFSRLDFAIRSLATNPRPHGVKKLDENLHRIRIGSWRVIYAILDSECRVVVLHVVRRSESTYRRLFRK